MVPQSNQRCEQCGSVASLWRVEAEGYARRLCEGCVRRYLLRLSPWAATWWTNNRYGKSGLAPTVRCAACQTEAAVLRERGMAGCAQCYRSLSPIVDEWLQRFGLSVPHRAQPLPDVASVPATDGREAAWLQALTPTQIVLSSRARYARNFEWACFPWRAQQTELDRVRQRVEQAARQSRWRFHIFSLQRMSATERRRWVEQRLASPPLQEGALYGSLIVDQARAVSILVNEEDHLRLQVILPGLQVRESIALARQVLEALALQEEFALSENYGWLTASVWNIGWGLRTSVMMYTPALERTGQLRGVWEAARELGATIRGLYGEGTPLGALFQVSNSHSLSIDEAVVAAQVAGTVQFIAQAELRAREKLLRSQGKQLQEEAEALYHNLRRMKGLESVNALQVLSVVTLAAMAGWASLDATLWKQMLLTAGWDAHPQHSEWRMWRLRQLVCSLREGAEVGDLHLQGRNG